MWEELIEELEEQPDIYKFSKKHSNSLNNPLIQSFLKDVGHFTLLVKSLYNPTRENKESLDQAFQEYYTGVKVINYLSKTLYWEAINFDKQMRAKNLRFPLVLDGTSNEEVSLPLIEMKEKSVENLVIENQSLPLIDRLENPKLSRNFVKLTDRQKEVLQHIYGSAKSITETASELNITQQGVSKIHKSAIKRLRKDMIHEGKKVFK